MPLCGTCVSQFVQAVAVVTELWWSDHGGNEDMVVFCQSHFTFFAMAITMTVVTMMMVGRGRE